ncbi:hypothetical protein, partial [Faecalibacterium taiwanense]|uniref:hypothetical protein n=1 Tax=Faecalibacterium taiwanense TaxID=3030638 RepID=UPI003AAAB1A0
LTPLSWMDDEMAHSIRFGEDGRCDHLVQCLMVMQAYGGGWHGTDGKFHRPFSMCEGYRSEIFKEFEKFDYRFGQVTVRSISLRKQQEQSWQITFEHECPSAGFPAVPAVSAGNKHRQNEVSLFNLSLNEQRTARRLSAVALL